jgi:hypothetical protein
VLTKKPVEERRLVQKDKANAKLPDLWVSELGSI